MPEKTPLHPQELSPSVLEFAWQQAADYQHVLLETESTFNERVERLAAYGDHAGMASLDLINRHHELDIRIDALLNSIVDDLLADVQSVYIPHDS